MSHMTLAELKRGLEMFSAHNLPTEELVEARSVFERCLRESAEVIMNRDCVADAEFEAECRAALRAVLPPEWIHLEPAKPHTSARRYRLGPSEGSPVCIELQPVDRRWVEKRQIEVRLVQPALRSTASASGTSLTNHILEAVKIALGHLKQESEQRERDLERTRHHAAYTKIVLEKMEQRLAEAAEPKED